jgi:hypothetical protein
LNLAGQIWLDANQLTLTARNARTWLAPNTDKGLYIAFLEGYILRKTPFQIVPNTILKSAFQVMAITDLARIIGASEYNEKNKWVFAMFANWPDELLDDEVLRQWYDYLARPDNKFTSSPFRQLDFLD